MKENLEQPKAIDSLSAPLQRITEEARGKFLKNIQSRETKDEALQADALAEAEKYFNDANFISQIAEKNNWENILAHSTDDPELIEKNLADGLITEIINVIKGNRPEFNNLF